MLEDGIIPFTRDVQQPTAYLKTIPKEEATAIKRRFRKLFRRAVRQKTAHMRKQGMDPSYAEWWAHIYGIGLTKTGLSNRTMKNRRSAVRTLLTIELIRAKDANKERAPVDAVITV